MKMETLIDLSSIAGAAMADLVIKPVDQAATDKVYRRGRPSA
jgi:hypothetical protein